MSDFEIRTPMRKKISYLRFLYKDYHKAIIYDFLLGLETTGHGFINIIIRNDRFIIEKDMKLVLEIYKIVLGTQFLDQLI